MNSKSIAFLCLLSFISFSVQYVELEDEFTFDEIEDPTERPIFLNEENYGQLVQDQSTGKLIDSKPWILYFYKFKCPFCSHLKPTIGKLA